MLWDETDLPDRPLDVCLEGYNGCVHRQFPLRQAEDVAAPFILARNVNSAAQRHFRKLLSHRRRCPLRHLTPKPIVDVQKAGPRLAGPCAAQRCEKLPFRMRHGSSLSLTFDLAWNNCPSRASIFHVAVE